MAKDAGAVPFPISNNDNLSVTLVLQQDRSMLTNDFSSSDKERKMYVSTYIHLVTKQRPEKIIPLGLDNHIPHISIHHYLPKLARRV